MLLYRMHLLFLEFKSRMANNFCELLQQNWTGKLHFAIVWIKSMASLKYFIQIYVFNWKWHKRFTLFMEYGKLTILLLESLFDSIKWNKKIYWTMQICILYFGLKMSLLCPITTIKFSINLIQYPWNRQNYWRFVCTDQI